MGGRCIFDDSLGNGPKSLLSIFDHSGNWPAHFENAGHTVWHCNLKSVVPFDVAKFDVGYFFKELGIEWVDAIIAAPSCTNQEASREAALRLRFGCSVKRQRRLEALDAQTVRDIVKLSLPFRNKKFLGGLFTIAKLGK